MTDAPGWYPDPLGRHMWRYFDGVVWTRQTSASAPEGARTLVDDHPYDEDDHLTEAQLLERGAVGWAAPAAEPEPQWDVEPEPELEPEPLIPEPVAVSAPPRPRHSARRAAGRTRRRRIVLALSAAIVVGAVVVVVSSAGGPQGLDRRHAVLRYEGEVLGERGTVNEIVVDGDDLLQDHQTSGQHGVSVIRDGTTYACRLDADPALCLRSQSKRAEAATRSALGLYLDPMSPDGTFGSGAAGAKAVAGRTVAGRASKCAVVTAGDRSDPYTVCRDAELGFLTSAKGPNLDLTLTSIRGPKAGEVRVPPGVDIQDDPAG
jgi:hypothetical protein